MLSRPWFAGVLVALLAALMLGSGLGRSSLYEPDEARHAEVAREMLERAEGWRDWMTLRHNFAPYRNKPAPFYWPVAASYAAFGVSASSARLPSAVAGLLTAVAVAVWAAAQWNVRTGVLAGAVLLTAPEFVLLGRFATLDMSLTLWVTLGVLAAHRFVDRPGMSLVPAAVAGAAGLLSKGLLGPGLIAVVGLVELARHRRLGLLAQRTVLVAGLVFLGLAVPWHLAAAAADPLYLRQLYVDQQWDRAVEASRRLHARSALFYVPVLLGGLFPWSALLPATVRGVLWPERRDDAAIFCAVWAGAVLLVFSLAQGKVASYLLPALPPLALLTGRFLGFAASGATAPLEARLLRVGLWSVAGVLALAPVAAIVLAASEYGGALVPTSLWSLIVLAPAVALAVLLRQDRLRAALLATAGTAATLVLGFYHLAAPALMTVHSDVAVAHAMLAAEPSQARVPLVGYHIASSSLLFYLRRPILLRDRPGQLRRLLEAHGRIFVVTSPRHTAELEAAGPFVRVFTGPRRVLYEGRIPGGTSPPRDAADGLGEPPGGGIIAPP